MPDSNANSQPAPTPETQRLSAFVGRWHTKGQVAESPYSPAVTLDGTDSYEWLRGGFSLLHYTDSAFGENMFHGIEIISFDISRGAYFAAFSDNQGGAGWEEIRADGNTWRWHGKNVMGVKFHRCTVVFDDDGMTAHTLHEQSEDDINWKTWIQVVQTKEA
jgi:hypothetical protein